MEHGVLTPLGLFTEAGPAAKAVMLMLVLASIWCWILIVEGAWSVRRLNRAVRALRGGGADREAALLEPLLVAGRQAASLTIAGESAGELRTRVVEAMNRGGQALLTRVQGGLPNLAVIASVAPFIGLFGTVWGIMTSFAGIAEAKDTSLAVVAPGIAEALAATAIGLAAAIPASVGYNRIGAALARAGQELSHFVEERAIAMTAIGSAAPERPARKTAEAA
ncbi:Biopolymer transport protein ExbB/TolQ [Rhizobiales bacterium GAS191]|nr:Biopolymer transport protein ExbB/TolQ [Rhizobiales bacterium GAS191]